MNTNSQKIAKDEYQTQKVENGENVLSKVDLDKNFQNFDADFVRSARIVSTNKEELWHQAQRMKLDIYVKTLLEVRRSLPNILRILDGIIEQRASTAFTTSSTYYQNTFEEIERVIALSERKDKLVNLYVITDKMLEDLKPSEKKFIHMKFLKKRSVDAISIEMGMTKRNVYRMSNSVIKKMCISMLQRGMDTSYIEGQMGEKEHWINEIFKKKLELERANLNRALKKSL